MSGKREGDLIAVEEAVDWLEWLRNPANASLVGADLIDKLTDDAVRAVKNAAVGGKIKRIDAIRAVRKGIPEMPPEDLDNWRRGKWGTLRAMYVEIMWCAEGKEAALAAFENQEDGT